MGRDGETRGPRRCCRAYWSAAGWQRGRCEAGTPIADTSHLEASWMSVNRQHDTRHCVQYTTANGVYDLQ